MHSYLARRKAKIFLVALTLLLIGLVPAVALAGTTRESIWAAKETGAEFVAIGRYWWRHEQGAAAAVLTALSILDGAEPRPEEAA